MDITKEETCKWVALFECLYQIYTFCERKGYDFDTVINRKLKSNHVKNYIDERWPYIEECVDKEIYDPEDDFLYNFIHEGK